MAFPQFSSDRNSLACRFVPQLKCMTIQSADLQLTGKKAMRQKTTMRHFTIRGHRMLAGHWVLYAHASCRCPLTMSPTDVERITLSPCLPVRGAAARLTYAARR
jgi:hypothetical protein